MRKGICDVLIMPLLRRFGSLPAAMLVLFSASARTRIVAADLGTGTDRLRLFHRLGGFADDVAGVGLGSLFAEGSRGFVGGLARGVAEELLERHHARCAAEDIVADLGFDVD